MFESLTDRLNKSFRNLMGTGKLSDKNMQDTLKDVKKALLEADVAYPVVKMFLKELKEEARGIEISSQHSPAQALIKIVNNKLIALMGDHCERLNLKAQPPAIILMSGLQGSGKTTSSAKLAKLLMERDAKSVMLASVDIYRPAAIEQLKTLANEVGAEFFEKGSLEKPIDIATQAVQAAKSKQQDVIIIDTAGRLHIDDKMMDEIKALHAALNPVETLFVVDGMTGQDAANTAKAFDDALPLTGVIVTKLDGDARGGAILSIRHVTGGKPIKFIGMGEKTDALEPFHPDRIASRILGMGDMLTLIEELDRKVDKKEAEKLAKKIQKGEGFDLEDFRKQLLQMQTMGGMGGLMDKLPGMGAIPQAAKDKANDKEMGKMLAIINSMTLEERFKPQILNGSRKRRISVGSGTNVQELNKVIKQFNMMQKVMKKVSKKGGMAKMLRGLEGQFPGGFPPIK